MENDNFWDWDNGDEHRVSSVYQDITQNDVEQTMQTQNVEPQNIESQNVEPQHHAAQDFEPAKNRISDSTEENKEVQNTEMQNREKPNDKITHDFILIDHPQDTGNNPTPQKDTTYVHTEYQQSGYQQNKYQQNEYQQNGNQQMGYQQNQYQQDEYQQNHFQPIVPVQNMQQNQGAKDQKADFSPKDISENKVVAMAAYLLGPIGIVIALLAARDSEYTAFHVRQALKLTVSSVALELVAGILALFGMIPFVGIIFKLVLAIIGILWLGILVLRLIAMVQVCDGEAREPAIIGKMNCFH